MNKGIPEITLHDGHTLPVIGLGTYPLKGNEGAQAIKNAIDIGYRLIDTAYNYENEGTVGEAIRRSSVPREELKITSKLPSRYHAYNLAVQAIQESLYRANLDYYDFYLLHWPNAKEDKFVEAWQALIDAKKWGLVRSIGVSNFAPENLERLKKETGVMPTVNQIELHPLYNQAEQRKYNEENNIITQAWSPLSRTNNVLENEILQTIANAHHKSISQVILRWHTQLGVVPIPKSGSAVRQLENISIFDFSLNDSEMNLISELTRPDGRNETDEERAVFEAF